jgi:hypothetical protein
MHLRVRPLQVLIELFLLVVTQDLADSFVGLIALGPHLGQALFARQAFVLHELLRGVMQFLENWCDSGLLIAGEIKLLDQHFQLLSDCRHVALCDALGGEVSVSLRKTEGSVRDTGENDADP